MVGILVNSGDQIFKWPSDTGEFQNCWKKAKANVVSVHKKQYKDLKIIDLLVYYR